MEYQSLWGQAGVMMITSSTWSLVILSQVWRRKLILSCTNPSRASEVLLEGSGIPVSSSPIWAVFSAESLYQGPDPGHSTSSTSPSSAVCLPGWYSYCQPLHTGGSGIHQALHSTLNTSRLHSEPQEVWPQAVTRPHFWMDLFFYFLYIFFLNFNMYICPTLHWKSCCGTYSMPYTYIYIYYIWEYSMPM